MDIDPPPSSTPRKVKFAPKARPIRNPKPATAKIEKAADNESDGEAMDAQQQALSQRVKEHLARRGPKVEKKSSVQVAFQHGTVSNELRTFGKQKERYQSDGHDVEESALDNKHKELDTSASTTGKEGFGNFAGETNAFIVKKKREYREPWDYHDSYYPTILPLRRPYSGNPELLDREEFENVADYDENKLNPSSELGLLDQDDEPRMLFVQFPATLPLGVPSAASKGKEIVSSSPKNSGISIGAKGKEIAGSSRNPATAMHLSKEVCSLEELPEGYMGKMLVYKSGAVKLKLGDILYDVSPGSDCAFAQSVMAIDTSSNTCCELGELNKRAVISPDIDSVVDNMIDLG